MSEGREASGKGTRGTRKGRRLPSRAQLNVWRDYIETSEQITALVDPQVQRALKEIPQAERMAVAFRRNKPSSGGFQAAVTP